MRLFTIAFTTLALLNFPSPQTDQAASLPAGVLKQLAPEEKEYCEDQYGDRFKTRGISEGPPCSNSAANGIVICWPDTPHEYQVAGDKFPNVVSKLG
jgi:hypothetical protein